MMHTHQAPCLEGIMILLIHWAVRQQLCGAAATI